VLKLLSISADMPPTAPKIISPVSELRNTHFDYALFWYVLNSVLTILKALVFRFANNVYIQQSTNHVDLHPEFLNV